jgi:hypothetical protein
VPEFRRQVPVLLVGRTLSATNRLAKPVGHGQLRKVRGLRCVEQFPVHVVNYSEIMVMLHDFIADHREQIIARCREKATTRSDSPPVPGKTEQGVPVLLDQLVGVLRAGVEPGPEIANTALLHGRDLLKAGFSVSEVVHTYGDVCQSVTEMAVEIGATISAEHFRLLNKCLDDAIASAVTEFSHKGVSRRRWKGGIRVRAPRVAKLEQNGAPRVRGHQVGASWRCRKHRDRPPSQPHRTGCSR